MKGMAIYSFIIICWSMLAMLSELAEGIDISTNVLAIGMWIPVVIFFILHLKNTSKSK